MKTTSIHIVGALILTVCLGISCRKELPARIGGDDDPVTVIATISDAADTKVTYAEDGTKLKSTWAVGDHIVGWDDAGNKLELEIASADRITSEGVAIFTPVTGSATLPTSGKIYMIYAPGKRCSDVVSKSLTVDLTTQTNILLPALMMATGTVSDRQIELDFSNEMAIVMVKTPKIPGSPRSTFAGLSLSGTNVFTSVTFNISGDALKMTPSVPGQIRSEGAFNVDDSGNTLSTFYFAVPPASSSAEVSIGTIYAEDFAFYSMNRTFSKNKCYEVSSPVLGNREYKINITNPSEGGTFSTFPAGRSPWGNDVAITATPASVYWELNTLSVTKTTTGDVGLTTDHKFNMPKHDVTVTGSFKKLQYVLEAASTTNGSFELYNGSNKITSGTKIDWGIDITVKATPATGYVVDKVKYNDGSEHTVDLDSSSAYKFVMPTHDTEVSVTFKIQVPGTTPEYPIINW